MPQALNDTGLSANTGQVMEHTSADGTVPKQSLFGAPIFVTREKKEALDREARDRENAFKKRLEETRKRMETRGAKLDMEGHRPDLEEEEPWYTEENDYDIEEEGYYTD